MRVGFGKVDVTPKHNVDLAGFRLRQQPMTGVLDPLFVRTIAFEDEAGHRAILAEADNLGAPFELLKTVRKAVSERCGVIEADIHMAATHTHSAPCLVPLRDGGDPDPEYVRSFVDAVAESAGSALSGLRPARFGLSRFRVDLARDRRMSHGKPRRGPQLDTEALALWVYEKDPAEPFGAIINYGCHAVVMRDRRVSADWPGATCKALEEHFGSDFLPVVIPGGGANLNPMQCGEAAHLSVMGEALAKGAVGSPVEEVAADGAVETRSAGYRMRFRIPREEELFAYIEQLESREDLPDWESTCLKWAVEKLDALREGILPRHVDIVLNVLAVAGLRFVLLPFETFSETARAIRSVDPGRVFVASCADGILGYLPIDSAYDEGGYEVEEAPKFYDSFPPARGSAEEVVKAIRWLL